MRQLDSCVGDESCADQILTGDCFFFVLNRELSRVILSPFCFAVIHSLALQNNRTSIDAQKLVDERHRPFKVHNSYQVEMRSRPNFRQLPAISSYAGQDIGNAGSYSALKSYQFGFAKRRDEILTEIAKNG